MPPRRFGRMTRRDRISSKCKSSPSCTKLIPRETSPRSPQGARAHIEPLSESSTPEPPLHGGVRGHESHSISAGADVSHGILASWRDEVLIFKDLSRVSGDLLTSPPRRKARPTKGTQQQRKPGGKQRNSPTPPVTTAWARPRGIPSCRCVGLRVRNL
jgi:hypothetical protein